MYLPSYFPTALMNHAMKYVYMYQGSLRDSGFVEIYADISALNHQKELIGSALIRGECGGLVVNASDS